MDSPPAILADWLVDHGWTLADLEQWHAAVVAAFLNAGGWETVPAGLVLEEWELVLPSDRHDAHEAA
jgi:hypothetical protein